MVKIYGASDDLVEIEGSNFLVEHEGRTHVLDEVGCFDSDVIFNFTDGTQIRIGYGKFVAGVELAIWKIDVVKQGTAWYTLTICTNEDAAIYSDIFEIDAEITSYEVVE